MVVCIDLTFFNELFSFEVLSAHAAAATAAAAVVVIFAFNICSSTGEPHLFTDPFKLHCVVNIEIYTIFHVI